MQQYDDLDAIHIVSHGDVGELSLGSTKLNQNTLNSYANGLITWRDSITDNGDILLYGCNVAENTVGKEFVEDLSQYTAADVLASTDLTGSEDFGGDWDLEFATGDIEEDLAFDAEIQSSYQHTLVGSNFTSGAYLNNYLDVNFPEITGGNLNFNLGTNLNTPDSSQLNNIANIDLEKYDFKNPRYNRELFNFEPSQINFNASDFDYNSVDINNDSITFGFVKELDFTPSVDSIESLEFSFDDYTFDFDSRFSFNADSVTFENNKVKFEFDSNSLDFRGADLFSADNVHLFEYKLLNNEITLPDGELTFADFNASDFRALDYAYPGDELFDGEYYFDNNVIPADMNPFTDYIENGYKAGRNPNGLFNVNYYRDSNIDVKNNGMDPLKHFVLYGNSENFDTRDPNPLFDSSYYNAKNPDVVKAGMNSLLHYIQFGWKESRIDNPGGFNPNRDPSPFLDTSYYFDKNIDVLQASYLYDSANPNQHYLEFGNFGLYANEDRPTYRGSESENIVRITRRYSPDSDPEEISNLKESFKSNGYNLETKGENFEVSQIDLDPIIEGGTKLLLGIGAWTFYTGLKIIDAAGNAFIELTQNLEDRFDPADDAVTFSGYTTIPLDTTPTDAVTIDYGDPSLEDLLRIRPFPGQTENQIVAEIFTTPEIDGVEDFTIFPEDSGIFLPTTTEFPLRDETLEAILNGGMFTLPVEEENFPGFYTINTDPFSALDKNLRLDLGIERELKVANLVGGFKIIEPGRPNEDLKISNLNNPGDKIKVDVAGPNKELIFVGGPKKADRLKKLESDLKTLKRIAISRNLTAQQYFVDNTPQSAIDKAVEILGANNVFLFPEVTTKEASDLIQLPIVRNTVNF